jgi:hypothetical protein
MTSNYEKQKTLNNFRVFMFTSKSPKLQSLGLPLSLEISSSEPSLLLSPAPSRTSRGTEEQKD